MNKTIPKTKICCRCKIEKNISLFYRNKSRKDGYDYHCIECDKTKGKIYYSKNKDSVSKRCKKRYKENKEYILEQCKEYYYKNKEKITERHKKYNKTNHKIKKYYKKYRELNKDTISEYGKKYRLTDKGKLVNINSRHKRRTREKHGDVKIKELQKLKENAQNCYWCGKSLKKKKVHLDHYVPLFNGGMHTISNIVVSCSDCNLSKSSKDPIVFANTIGKLL